MAAREKQPDPWAGSTKELLMSNVKSLAVERIQISELATAIGPRAEELADLHVASAKLARQIRGACDGLIAEWKPDLVEIYGQGKGYELSFDLRKRQFVLKVHEGP